MNGLGKRAIEAGWKWMPGMRIRGIDEICIGATANQGFPFYRNGYGQISPVPHAEPDLSDPATLGCLLALVREAYQCPWLSVVGNEYDWRIDEDGVGDIVSELHSLGSEAEALVAALEAAE